jgi:hypothetical protein
VKLETGHKRDERTEMGRADRAFDGQGLLRL